MSEFGYDIPVSGYILEFSEGDNSVWCENCYKQTQTDETLKKVIREGKHQSGSETCSNCGADI